MGIFPSRKLPSRAVFNVGDYKTGCCTLLLGLWLQNPAQKRGRKGSIPLLLANQEAALRFTLANRSAGIRNRIKKHFDDVIVIKSYNAVPILILCVRLLSFQDSRCTWLARLPIRLLPIVVAIKIWTVLPLHRRHVLLLPFLAVKEEKMASSSSSSNPYFSSSRSTQKGRASPKRDWKISVSTVFTIFKLPFAAHAPRVV